jgi:large subunit ribosomal protein L17
MRSLAQALVIREKIKTTASKAKELRPFVEKLVTRSKTNGVVTRRFLVNQVGDEGAKKLVEVLGPKFNERAGGYTRITKLPRRMSDGSTMAQIEFV